MKIKDQIAAMDEIVRDLFRSGGPQRPSNPRTRSRRGPCLRRQTDSATKVLLAEQQRLIDEWERNDD